MHKDLFTVHHHAGAARGAVQPQDWARVYWITLFQEHGKSWKKLKHLNFIEIKIFIFSKERRNFLSEDCLKNHAFLLERETKV